MNISPLFIIAAISGVVYLTYIKKDTASDDYSANTSASTATATDRPVLVIETGPPPLNFYHDHQDVFKSAKEVSERPIVDVRSIPASYAPIDYSRLAFVDNSY